MAGLKLSDFDTADPLDGSEPIGTVQGGANVQTTAAEVAALAGTLALSGDAYTLLAFGAGGAVRKDIPFVTPQMFGALGDNVTDDGPAFLAALAYLKANANAAIAYGIGASSLFIPKGRYYLGTSTLDLDFTVHIYGEGGWGGASTVLRWNNVTGIRGQAYNTSGAITVDGVTHYGATGSIIERIALVGGYAGVESEAHGVQMKNPLTLRDVAIYSFSGDGVHIVAVAGGGAPDEGNANCFMLDRVFAQGCRNGFYIDSADVNAGQIIGCSAVANRRWGVWDSSFLGNTYVGCHASGNGWDGAATSIATACTYLGNRYAVLPDQGVWCSTNAPSGTTANNTGWAYLGVGGVYNGMPAWVSGTTFRDGGSYRTDDANASNVFMGCYSESDQNPANFLGPTLGLGGSISVFDRSGNVHPFMLRAGSIGQLVIRDGILYFGAGGTYGSITPSFGGILIDGPNTVLNHSGTYVAQVRNGALDVASLEVANLKVVGARGAAVADAVAAVAAPTMAEFNALVTQFNLLLARVRAATGHGLIA